MPRLTSALSNLKETLLIVAVLYFYGLAFALFFGRETFGLDAPAVFILMGGIFLFAVILEAVVALWNLRRFLLWLLLGALSYGIIGLYFAPVLYGPGILPYVLLEPLVIVFVGGFAFAYGRILTTSFFSSTRMTSSQLSSALSRLPGWKTERGGIEKTYAFEDFSEALNFLNRVAGVVVRSGHRPEIRLKGKTVMVHLTTPEKGGVTETDIVHAKKFDALA